MAAWGGLAATQDHLLVEICLHLWLHFQQLGYELWKTGMAWEAPRREGYLQTQRDTY